LNFSIYDIYVDASIDLDKKLSCSGMVTVNRRTNEIVDQKYLLIPDSTNNKGEIAAIWLGVISAINIKQFETQPYIVNIFSDSQISLFGVRTWILNWVRNYRNGLLYTASGPVSNQEWYRDIYHMIIMSGIKLKFFHIKGHVSVNNPKSVFEAETMFRRSNYVSPNNIGLTPQTISCYNNLVDDRSRRAIYSYLDSGMLPDPSVTIGGTIPIILNEYTIQDRKVYSENIKGGLNYPINYTMEVN